MRNKVCKICRRAGQKLFLKGEKCYSPKCPFLKKSYPPGQKSKKRRTRRLSEYGKELLEKQRVRYWYGLSEKQFANYVKDILNKRGEIQDTSLRLIRNLEKRLDNVVFKLGFAPSRKQARQLVNHGHFLVNGKSVNIPSYQVKKDDLISLKESKKKKKIFGKTSLNLSKVEIPKWLKMDKKKLEGKVVAEPSFEDAGVPAEIPAIFEYYSR